MGQVSTGPVDYPHEEEKKQAEPVEPQTETQEEPSHEPAQEGVDTES